MKKKHIISLPLILLMFLTLFLFLTGCSGGKTAIGCPFTELSWNDSKKDMEKIEGEPLETYDSIYNGTTYTYSKKYLEKDGVVKYMYDDKDQLCNVAWSYTGETAEDVIEVYKNVCSDTEKKYGTGTSDDGVGNYCQMWITDSETIMANAVITNDVTVMQIAYMSSKVSKQGK